MKNLKPLNYPKIAVALIKGHRKLIGTGAVVKKLKGVASRASINRYIGGKSNPKPGRAKNIIDRLREEI